MEIVDQFGRPFDRGAMTEVQARASLAGIRNIWHDSQANGLTPESLSSILLNAANNDAGSYLTLAEEMEERDCHYHSQLSTRRMAVTGLDQMVEAYSDTPEDIKIADYVREILDDGAFSDVVFDLLDATGKGYSAVEIIWRMSGTAWVPDYYKWADPHHFMFDQDEGRELRLIDEEDTAFGVKLKLHKWMIHEPRLKSGIPLRGGLARLVAAIYMCKSYTISDWMAFAEVFGMPLRMGRYPTGANQGDINTLISAVANIGTDAGAVFPDTMDIEFEKAATSSGGQVLFLHMVEWFDKQVSKAVIGQTMTADDGSSQSQANVHNDVRADIKDHDAMYVARTIRRDLIAPIVGYRFGWDKNLPTYRLGIDEPEDLKAMSDALVPLIDRGLPVEISVILDKFGIEEPADGAAILKPKATGAVSPNGDKDDGDDGDPDDGDDAEKDNDAQASRARAHDQTVAFLTRRVADGATITPAQERYLTAALASDAVPVIERVAGDHLAHWPTIMDPILKPILALAAASKTEDEFLAGFAKLNLDGSKFTNDIASAMFKAHAMGDVSDRT